MKVKKKKPVDNPAFTCTGKLFDANKKRIKMYKTFFLEDILESLLNFSARQFDLFYKFNGRRDAFLDYVLYCIDFMFKRETC